MRYRRGSERAHPGLHIETTAKTIQDLFLDFPEEPLEK